MALVDYVRLYLSVLFFSLCNINTTSSLGWQNQVCQKLGPCQCSQMSGMGIDLRPLNNINTSTKFLTVATNNTVYFYHPCSDWPLLTFNKTECKTGAVLCYFKANGTSNVTLDVDQTLSNTSNGTFYKLASAEEAVFETNADLTHQIVYKSGDKSSTIKLNCAQTTTNELTIVDASKNILSLSSPYACLKSEGTPKHMSGFAVFLIILLSIFALYFIGGMLVLKFIRGAEGREIIPNYEFWVRCPAMMKDGFLYLISCGRNEPDSYERI